MQQNVAIDVADAPFSQWLASAGQPSSGIWCQILEAMNEGLLLVSPERRVVYINKRAEQLIGRSLEQVRGALCTDAINCPQCECICRLFDNGGAAAVEVTVFNHADASRRVLRKNARILRDDQGQTIGGVETFIDITRETEQRHEAEHYVAMLFQEKTRLEALLGAMEEGAFAIDAAHRVVSCSKRLAEMLGIDPASAVGRPLCELFAVAEDFFGERQAGDLDGRCFDLPLERGSERQRASLSFRRVRLSDDEMLGVVRRNEKPRHPVRTRSQQDRFHGILSCSPAMREVFRIMECAAQSQAHILIEGESGVGKELVARAIHELSPYAAEPFYGVNCGTFSGSLLLSELFGHERGAFTGAFRTTPGKLELAARGTLFLDEVSEIPLQYQAALLRVLEERYFERVGGRKRIDLHARVVAATNRRLREAVEARQFRQDLYFRLRVIPIEVPPLRERTEDIALLARHFAALAAAHFGAKPIHFTDDAFEAMSRYAWPGNVRELRNMVEYLCFVSTDVISVKQLPPEVAGRSVSASSSPAAARPTPLVPDPLEQHERSEIQQALQQAHFRKADAAQALGIDRSTLWRKMKRLGL